MKVCVISPYHGGSHRAWANGLVKNSNHEQRLLTLPDRFWKWRMHGGAITLAREFLEEDIKVDCLLATDMLDLTTFLALTRRVTADIPTILYMHENQLTYPLPDEPGQGPMRRQKGERDRHYGFINIASMQAADLVLFNSSFHRQQLFAELPVFLRHFPDFNEREIPTEIYDKSQVVPVGVDFRRLTMGYVDVDFEEPPLIIWNQRWEYDKNPERFFDVLYQVYDSGVPFRLALCGRNYRQQPEEFAAAVEKLAPVIVHSGYADQDDYRRLLWEATVTISTARHEFFGVSILEAISSHTFPILPHDLSYPEIVPAEYHNLCLYLNQEELLSMLIWSLRKPAEARKMAAELAQGVGRFDWSEISRLYDEVIEGLVLDF